MAALFISSYIFSILNLQLCIFLFLTRKPISCFAHQALDNNPNFGPHLSLFGDAKVKDESSSAQLTRLHAPSSGLLLLQKPFKFAKDRNVDKPMSFSTDFSFSISPGNGDGLAFVLVPNGFQTRFQRQGSFGLSGEKLFLGVEFDTMKDDKVGDFNANHVGIDVKSLESVKVRNLSSLGLVLNNGEILKSWIDYDSSSKLLQVRLSKLNYKRPFSPILAYHIDLSEMWGDKDVYVGIISTNNDESSHTSISSNIYSWRFTVRDASSWMHSLPADPRGYVDDKDGYELKAERKRFCALTILAGLIFATGCGALIAFVMLFVYAILASRHTVFPIELQPNGPGDFKYEKVNVIVEEDQR